MASKQSKLLLAGLSVVAVVVGVLLVSSVSKKKKPLTYRVTGVEPVGQGVAAPERPSPPAAARAPAGAPQAARPSPPAAAPTPGAAAPVDAGAADSGGVAAKKPPPAPLTLKQKARTKQLGMYRQQLASVRKQRAKLLETLARVKREGAPKEAIESLQRRLQHLIEAEPRLKAHLESLEKSSDE